MDYRRSDETFEIAVGNSYLTKNLPMKWSCTFFMESGFSVAKFIKFNHCESPPAGAFTLVYFGECTELIEEKAFQKDDEPRKLTHKIDSMDNVISINPNLDQIRVTISSIFPNLCVSKKVGPLISMDLQVPETAHDHVLNVGEEKFYVQKALLSFYSPYFERLFNGNFEDSKKDENTLEEVDPKEFGTLLQILYPGSHGITEKNVAFVWKLADRYAITCVTDMCEQFITNLDDNPENIIKLSERIELAEQYKSAKIMASIAKLLKARNE